ncbi:MAG: tetratricopeptide repeat protein [Firmicutes bacterium]|nr:tetratricopeptide repeat protein [Bacillota bacterium]
MSTSLEELLARADRAFRQRRLEEAYRLYQEAVTRAPDLAVARSRLGAVLAMMNRLDEAEAMLQEALRLDPNLAAAHSNLGNVAYTRGDYRTALECYRKAVALEPDNPIYHDNLHAAYKKLGQYDKAVAAYKHARKLERRRQREAVAAMPEAAGRRAGCGGAAALAAICLFGLWLALRG